MTDLPTFRLFGLRLTTAFPFASKLERVSGPAGIHFEIIAEPPVSWDPVALQADYESPLLGENGKTILEVYRLREWDVLSFTEVADFYLCEDQILAQPVHPHQPLNRTLVEIRLLGAVMAYWLESRGHPALHASAVAVGGGAVGFLGANRGGKTSLAAALVGGGGSLLTDDILALQMAEGEVAARPGYPQMRLWPAAAEHFLGGRWADYPRIHPKLSKRRVGVGENQGWGRFCSQLQPLHRLYLPERSTGDGGDGAVLIEALSPRDSVIELVRYSFLPTLAAGLGWQGARLARLSQVAERVGVRRLAYPSGFGNLDRVREAVLADLDRTSHPVRRQAP